MYTCPDLCSISPLQKSLYRTFEKQKVRKYPPSYKEIGFVIERQPIEARVFLPDGHNMLIEFDSAASTEEVHYDAPQIIHGSLME